ncbi:citrate synthase/methylcitrate synthase [Paenibacillus filicis]|uniref:Citrate synthase n=1 Tax=Paenibacillus gyeongsangnamensis TaxID=3388067 RepID=A0ABT4QDG5_9BACL|nr:citrate synthase/methylcitrate synthase [Paenibacillus filicis]MCZ8514907.1 citrate synthase/methylcitrate synthase [Paenibacillus filicis]
MTVANGLEQVIVAETEISFVDGERGRLVFRGRWAKDLSDTHRFEEVAHLLWYGSLPSGEEKADIAAKWASEREISAGVKAVIDAIPREVGMMSVLRTAVSALETEGFGYPPTLEQAASITMKLPTIVAYCYRRLKGLAPVEPRTDLRHTANYLYMLKGEEASPVHVQALEAYLNLMMEHGMNSSTFAARVIASTRSDLISAVVGAIGALKGPLHGGAPSLVMNMLRDIGSKDRAEAWIRSKLENDGRIMGFGHRVYKTKDPRAEALRLIASRLSDSDPCLELAVHVEETAIRLLEEYKPGKKLYTNVEFYAAAVMNAIDFEEELFTPTFVVTRSVGWCAHILEAAAGRLIYPDSAYVGQLPSE